MSTANASPDHGLDDSTPWLAATATAVWAVGLVALAAFLVLLLAPTPPWP